MHELAICQALISQVEDVVRERSARVKRVLVGIGPLSGVEPRLLEARLSFGQRWDLCGRFATRDRTNQCTRPLPRL